MPAKNSKKKQSKKTPRNIEITDKKWKVLKNTISNLEELELDAVINKTFINNLNYEGDAFARYHLNLLIYLKNNPGGEILKQDAPEENDDDGDDPRDAPPPIIFGEVIEGETCREEFFTSRQLQKWYRSHSWTGPLASCSNARPKNLQESVSIPIYYVVLSNNWTNDLASSKMEEAKSWFEKYCVKLQTIPVIIPGRTKRRLIRELARKNQGWKKYTPEVGKTYKHLWDNYMQKPKRFLLILFVDRFTSVKYNGRVNRVAGNFSKVPVILIPHDPDIQSTHIVTHELIHGLGKKFKGGNPVKTDPFVTSQKNTWDEGACQNEMGNSNRANVAAPLRKTDDDLIDYASYWEMAKAGNIR